MITITILGSGNVAWHLIQTFLSLESQKRSPFVLRQVWARKCSDLPKNAQKIYCDIEDLKPTDLTIIAVSDRAISEVSSQIPYQKYLVVHTSGSTDFEAIDSKHNRGVFYPLQTFQKTKKINFKNIPILVESESARDLVILKNVASEISNRVENLNGVQRQKLHLAAVFACNFTNHFYTIAAKICATNLIDFELLKPLIVETSQKIQTIDPKDAQTGPAVRRDEPIIHKHLSQLEATQKEIYKLMTQSIQQYDKEL